MSNNNNAQRAKCSIQSFFLPTPHISNIIPIHWASKYFSMFGSILSLYLYIKMKNKKKPLASVIWQPIPCKTGLRENF